jgi:hypothetical protein
MGIRIIPVSLAVILLFTAFGPLGSTAMSVRSQANRIREIMRSNGMAVIESASETPPQLESDDRREMSEALRFLLERNAVGTVRDVFGEPSAAALEGFDPEAYGLVDSAATVVMQSVGQEYMTQYYSQPADYFAVERPVDGEVLAIGGFDYAVALAGHDSTRVVAGPGTFRVVSDLSQMRIVLRRPPGDTLLVFDLRPLVDTMFALEPSARNAIPLELSVAGDQVRGMLALAWISAERRDGVIKVTAWRGDLYLRFVNHPDPANVPARLEPGR